MPRIAPITSGLLLAALAGCRSEKVAPPVPHGRGGWVDTLPPVPTSYLDVPVRFDLAPGLRWLESEVPARFGDVEDKQAIPGKPRVHYAYEAALAGGGRGAGRDLAGGRALPGARLV